jgi:glycosyltransferase involved in cell wall biosynthesis
MSKPLFSICVITKNEAKTLPRLIQSLKEFQERGGEIVVVDTGSTDDTVAIATKAGCKVEAVGDKFITILDAETADKINKRFVVDSENEVVSAGKKFFDFSAARNYCATLASNDMISCADADEMFTKLNIDELNMLILAGCEQFEYNFVYAHDEYGKEAIKFIQSKFYDRRKCKWVNRVHEVLSGDAKRQLLDESTIKLEHHQQPAEHRGNYLSGLAYDCYLNPGNDRNLHYFARELMYCGRPKSALKAFNDHIAMNGWPAEKAQSYIFRGDCFGMLNMPESQVESYNNAIFVDPTRREAFIKLARFYKANNKPAACAAYAAAAMEIPLMPFYANDMAHYTHEPHALMYWAKGWLGDIESAKKHLLIALEYQPKNKDYLRDLEYYFPWAKK